MSLSVVQTVWSEAGTGSTITGSITPTAGNDILVVMTLDDTANPITVSDPVNGSYSVLGSRVSAGNAHFILSYYVANVSGSTANITVNFTIGPGTYGICIMELSGAGTPITPVGSAQTGSVLTTDWATSGNITPSTSSGLLVALSLDYSFGSAPTAGTGFTSLGSGWQFGFGFDHARAEYIATSSTTALAGTFTPNNGGDEFLTTAIFFPSKGPSISSQPTNAFAYSGATATFSVTATGSGTVTYQWKLNGSNISGATSSSYTTGTLSYSDNGGVYSVVVTDSVTSLTSNNATLTVPLTASLLWIKA